MRKTTSLFRNRTHNRTISSLRTKPTITIRTKHTLSILPPIRVSCVVRVIRFSFERQHELTIRGMRISCCCFVSLRTWPVVLSTPRTCCQIPLVRTNSRLLSVFTIEESDNSPNVTNDMFLSGRLLFLSELSKIPKRLSRYRSNTQVIIRAWLLVPILPCETTYKR